MLSSFKRAPNSTCCKNPTSDDGIWADYPSRQSTPGPIPEMPPSPPNSASPLHSQLFCSIGQLEQVISNCEPDDEQVQYITAQLEGITSYLQAPQAQSREPSSSLFDSGLVMDLDDSSSENSPRLTIPLDDSQYSRLLPAYSSGFAEITAQLQKRLRETHELNELCLERVKHAEVIMKAYQATNEKHLLDLHLDYSELLFLKLQLDKIKRLSLPSTESVQTFDEAVKRFELNWRDVEQRLSASLDECIAQVEPISHLELELDDDDDDDDDDKDEFYDAEERQASAWDFWVEATGLIDYYELFGFDSLYRT